VVYLRAVVGYLLQPLDRPIKIGWRRWLDRQDTTNGLLVLGALSATRSWSPRGTRLRRGLLLVQLKDFLANGMPRLSPRPAGSSSQILGARHSAGAPAHALRALVAIH